jgi:hypothetical protein
MIEKLTKLGLRGLYGLIVEHKAMKTRDEQSIRISFDPHFAPALVNMCGNNFPAARTNEVPVVILTVTDFEKLMEQFNV